MDRQKVFVLGAVDTETLNIGGGVRDYTSPHELSRARGHGPHFAEEGVNRAHQLAPRDERAALVRSTSRSQSLRRGSLAPRGHALRRLEVIFGLGEGHYGLTWKFPRL